MLASSILPTRSPRVLAFSLCFFVCNEDCLRSRLPVLGNHVPPAQPCILASPAISIRETTMRVFIQILICDNAKLRGGEVRAVPLECYVKPFLNQGLSVQFDSPGISENRNTIDLPRLRSSKALPEIGLMHKRKEASPMRQKGRYQTKRCGHCRPDRGYQRWALSWIRHIVLLRNAGCLTH